MLIACFKAAAEFLCSGGLQTASRSIWHLPTENPEEDDQGGWRRPAVMCFMNFVTVAGLGWCSSWTRTSDDDACP